MTTGPDVLILTSLTAGIAHTLLGPDHYLPFIVLSKSRGWSWRKTFGIMLVCGLGHILSAVMLGYLTIQMGFSLEKLNLIESLRGNLAGWALLVFGLIYLTWGLRLAFRKSVDIASPGRFGLLPWVLFIVFVFGPCEPLIPIMIYPVLHQNLSGALVATSFFGVATISTMLTVVTTSYYGLNVFAFQGLGRFAHALAGLTIVLCGIGIRFFGL